MAQCPMCRCQLVRSRRTTLQKLSYSDVFVCRICGQVTYVRHRLPPGLAFVMSFHTSCMRCGTPDVLRMRTRDRIDSISKHLVSLLFQASGAPLNKCDRCRL